MFSDEANDKPTPLESQELRELKKKRKSYRGKLTMYCHFVKKFREINVEKLSASQILDLQLRTEAVGSIYNILDTIQERIDVLCTDIDEQLADRQKYDDAYFENVAHAKLMINSKQSGHTPNQVQVVNVQNKPETQDIIRYPEISLPSFSGGMNDWLEFRETFDSLINQSQMNSIQKYKYLRSCLQGGALEVVSSLEFTSENYSLAWNLLCERYNNPRLLINKHLKGLFNMETISLQASSLRSVIDNISKHLRSLKSLSVPVSEWDLVIIHFISSKLPLSIQRKWEERISSKELPSLQEFKEFLRSQADLLEVSHSDEVSSDSRDKRSLVATSSSVTPRPDRQNLHQCPQCKGKHYINQCPGFLSLSPVMRIRAVKRSKLCLNCLSPNHAVINCRSSTCRQCQGKHNTLLHIPTEGTQHQQTIQSHPTTLLNSHLAHTNQQTNHTENKTQRSAGVTNEYITTTTQPQTNKAFAQPSANKSNSARSMAAGPATLTNTVTSHVVHNKTIFLSTARVYVFDSKNKRHTLRILLDSGAQSNFISERAYRLLNLPKHKIDMQVIGFSEISTKIDYLCEVKLQSRSDTYSTNLTCLIVPSICNVPNYAINPKYLNIPQQIKLADEEFHISSEIDMLLGAELFYELMCSEQYKLGKGLPTLQSTRLGWIVTGALVNAPRKNKLNQPRRVWRLPLPEQQQMPSPVTSTPMIC